MGKQDKTKPHDHDLARRIVRAAGISDDELSDRAKKELRRLIDVDNRRVEDGQQPAPAEPRDLWNANSATQLRRWFGGRCVTCAWWQPDDKTEIDNYGKCAHITDQATDASIRVGNRTEALTAPVFGCILWEEIDAGDHATIAARTDLGMTIGLIERYPGDKAVTG